MPILETEEGVEVEYELVEKERRGEGWRHNVFHLTIRGLEDPVLDIDKGQLAVSRLIHLTPQPIGDHHHTVWNGDTEDPTLRFDWWDPEKVEVRLEVWGT